MAGYFLYSLDWSKVEAFMNDPQSAELMSLAEIVSDELDNIDSVIDDDDPLASWPSEPAELQSILAQQVMKPDWYGALSEPGKALWENSITDLFEDGPFGFECESDGVYWNILSETLKHHGLKDDFVTDLEVSHFGTRPFRFLAKGKRSADGWYPYHSMHTPAEVKNLQEQFTAAEKTILASRHEEVREDYEELMPVLDKLVQSGRVLYVGVDT